MAEHALSDIAAKMRDIDIAMLSTRTDGDEIASRPMSNNAQVDYDGDSYYFAMDSTRMVADIRRDPKVSLTFQGDEAVAVAVEGKAELITDQTAFEEHWSPDLDRWFEDGTATEGLVMIKVRAVRVRYWDGEDGGEVKL